MRHRLTSTPEVYTPGVVRQAIRLFGGGDKEMGVRLMTEGYSLGRLATLGLLAEAYPYEVVGGGRRIRCPPRTGGLMDHIREAFLKAIDDSKPVTQWWVTLWVRSPFYGGPEEGGWWGGGLSPPPVRHILH